MRCVRLARTKNPLKQDTAMPLARRFWRLRRTRPDRHGDTEKKESRIDAVEMRSLRGMSGVSRKDRCRNRDARERCGLKEDVVSRVDRGVLRRLGQLERMNESRLTKQVYRANVCDGKAEKELI
ncbi:hypothetical protein EVAR_37025_1 [Eumeta japonica]|uniref:Uncharacterized protein n=1 Tax=Eumeta variegata TaxID=151549 RepID=A0A4C1WHD6_EUMVA|nr:hypothetical protein EVAR_37025_1 [Eumeta japonica]